MSGSPRSRSRVWCSAKRCLVAGLKARPEMFDATTADSRIVPFWSKCVTTASSRDPGVEGLGRRIVGERVLLDGEGRADRPVRRDLRHRVELVDAPDAEEPRHLPEHPRRRVVRAVHRVDAERPAVDRVAGRGSVGSDSMNEAVSRKVASEVSDPQIAGCAVEDHAVREGEAEGIGVQDRAGDREDRFRSARDFPGRPFRARERRRPRTLIGESEPDGGVPSQERLLRA